MQALALGTPIVTIPSEFLRGRITRACYQQMGYLDLVAGDYREYGELVAKLGLNEDFRSQSRAAILAASPCLYEASSAVKDLEAFFRDESVYYN